MMVRGRLAPSPTGAQHLGNARTYLLAWLSARAQGGEVCLRIEDIDSPRVKLGATESLLADLAWLGFTWEVGTIVQTARLSLYEAALRKLQELELVYPCTCTRGDIERAASAPHAEHEGPVYPGTCAHRSAQQASSLGTVPIAWRFRVPPNTPTFADGVLGKVTLNLRELGGDFVVWKSSGTPAYQLAVVVDDAEAAITEVLRGDDLLPSTPRQILLYHALGLVPPRFMHVPLVVGPDGRRLAKRHGDTRLSLLRARGASPNKLLGFLAWSCGLAAFGEETTLTELLPRFSLSLLPRTPLVLTQEHLRYLGYD